MTNFDSQQNNEDNGHEEAQNEFAKLFVEFLGVEVIVHICIHDMDAYENKLFLNNNIP